MASSSAVPVTTVGHTDTEVTVDPYVTLECIREANGSGRARAREHGRLRVRVTSPGYYNDANCMFPRAIRIPGRRFRIRRENLSLITSRGKYYYSTGSPAGIEILPDVPTPTDVATITAATAKLKIYEDMTSVECAICFERAKDTIIDPCGHFYMCGDCARTVTKCPICRGPIAHLINKSQMQ